MWRNDFKISTIAQQKALPFFNRTKSKCGDQRSRYTIAVVYFMSTNYRVETAVFNWARISTLLAICFIIIDCIYCIRKGQKSAWVHSHRFICIYVRFGTAKLCSIPARCPAYLFPPTTFHVGITYMKHSIITAALIYRFWSRKGEKQQERETKIR